METKLTTLRKLDKGAGETSVKYTGKIIKLQKDYKV